MHGQAGGGGGAQADTSDLEVAWLNPPWGSFDNVVDAMFVLYVASTGDGWEEFMWAVVAAAATTPASLPTRPRPHLPRRWAGMDVTGVDKAPVRNDSSPASAYFIAWMIVGCFVAINLFVGAIVDNFTRIKKETDGSASMTPEQQQWADAMKNSLTGGAMRTPREPQNPVRRACFRLVRSEPFDYLVMGVIVLNVFGMACEYEGLHEDADYGWKYEAGMLFFSYFYYCECVLKLTGLGPANYFGDGWCRFDFFLVCVSLMDQFFLELLLYFLPVPPTLLRVLRVARVLRILRLVKNLKGLRDLALTLVYAFPALVNVGALLFIVSFIYAVLGMNLFCRVQHQENISDDRNFESFGSAMMLLFQCITGDGWSAFMYDCT